jgi:hypothetical protein
MFCASMFVLLCCFFWPLYYLTFYDLHGFCLPLWYLRITILLVSSEYSFGILWYPFGIFRSSSLRYPLIRLWYLLSTPSVSSDTTLVSSDHHPFGILWYPFGIFWLLLRYSLIPLRYPLIPLWYLLSTPSVSPDTPLVSSDHHLFGIRWYTFGIFRSSSLRYSLIPLWYLQTIIPSVSSDTPLVSSEYSFGILWYPFGILGYPFGIFNPFLLTCTFDVL